MSSTEAPSDPSYRDLLLDGEEGEDGAAHGPGGMGFVTPLALLGGLLLTVVLARAGLHFFFLPIILPFGLGGGRALKRLFGTGHRRLRLQGGELSLLTSSLTGARRDGVVDVTSGVFVTLLPSGVWVNGVRDVTVRIVGRSGALGIALPGTESARLFRRRLGALLSDGDVPVMQEDDEDAVLQGAVAMRSLGEESADREGAAAAESITELSWPSDDGRSARTWLRFSRDRWALRMRSGFFGTRSTGGPGPVAATLVAQRETDPFGGITVRHALELRAEGETVAMVGEGLSKPELLFVARQVAHFASN